MTYAVVYCTTTPISTSAAESLAALAVRATSSALNPLVLLFADFPLLRGSSLRERERYSHRRCNPGFSTQFRTLRGGLYGGLFSSSVRPYRAPFVSSPFSHSRFPNSSPLRFTFSSLVHCFTTLTSPTVEKSPLHLRYSPHLPFGLSALHLHPPLRAASLLPPRSSLRPRTASLVDVSRTDLAGTQSPYRSGFVFFFLSSRRLVSRRLSARRGEIWRIEYTVDRVAGGVLSVGLGNDTTTLPLCDRTQRQPRIVSRARWHLN